MDQLIAQNVEPTRARLVTQARLQQARKTGAPDFELRPPEPGKGFDLLPEPQVGDLFYDIEGDPHFEEGLEYLHGVWAKLMLWTRLCPTAYASALWTSFKGRKHRSALSP